MKERDPGKGLEVGSGLNHPRSGVQQAEAALQRGDEELRALADTLPVLVSFIDSDLRYRFVNAGYERWLGVSRDDLIGRLMVEVIGEEAFAERRGRIDAALRGERQRFEATSFASDGTPRSIEIEYLPRRGAEGEVVGFYVLVSDITELKQAQEDLLQSTRRLDAILNNTDMAVFMMNGRQECVFMNKAAEHLTGYTFEETQGRPLHDVIHNKYPDGRHYPLEECPIDRAFPERNRVKGEELFVHKDGHFYPVGFTASPIRDQGGEAVGTIIEARNIADEKARDKALARRSEQLQSLAETALAVARAPTLDATLEEITNAALRIVGTHQAVVSLTRGSDWSQAINTVALSDKYAEWRDYDDSPLGNGIYALVCDENKAIRLTQEELEEHPRWRGFGSDANEHPPMRGWLAAPLVGRDGRNLGLIQLSDKLDGSDFDDADEAMLVQLAQLASAAVEASEAEAALREEGRTLDTLNKSGAAIAAELNLEQLVQSVTDAGVELTGAQFGAFFYNAVGETGEDLLLYTLSGAKRSDFESFGNPRATAIFHPTFVGEGPVRSDDITLDPRYGKNDPHKGMPKGHLPVRSYLAVSVVSRTGEVIGGLFFGHPEPARFNARHEDLMLGIAGQAAIGIDNARLFRSAQREVAERQRAEAELRRLNETLEQRVADEVARRAEAEEALRQAQKMETLGQLTGGVAHDFNNLLQIVTGNLEILQRNLPEAEGRLRRAADNAAKGADRAAVLTQRLLAFSRRQPLAPKPVNLNKLLGGMSELLHRTIGETIEVETVQSPGLWRVEADPNQLENAILNLAVNARDAMPGGGKLTIETANTHLDRAYVEQNAEVTPGQYVVICVSDTGTGMDEETVSRAFEPFFTTKEVGKGTGLGLSMVYGFVKQSGGHLKIYSEAGEGTTVKIYLPRLLTSGREQEEETAPVIVPEGAREEVVLVCEDDEDVRAYSVEVLRELGYGILEAHDGQSALRLLERPAVRVDLLFTDVVLPGGMTGAVLAEQARELRPDLKVLFTTGYARNAIVHHGRLDPGVELITKPFSYSDLAVRVRDLLDRSG